MTERAVASIHFWKIAFLHLVPFHTSLVSLFLIRALLGLSCSQAATWSPEKVWLHKDRTLVLGCRAVLSTGQTCTVCFGWLFLIFLLLHFNLLFSQWFLFIFNGLKVCFFFFLIVRTLLTIWGHNVCIVTSLKGLRPGSPSKGLYQILYPDSLSKQKCRVNRAEQVELNGDGADPVSCLLFNPGDNLLPFCGKFFSDLPPSARLVLPCSSTLLYKHSSNVKFVFRETWWKFLNQMLWSSPKSSDSTSLHFSTCATQPGSDKSVISLIPMTLMHLI